MNFSDTEVWMAINFDRAQRRTVAHGQALVDRKNSEIGMLTSALQKARADLQQERLARISAEEELAALRKLVFEAL